MFKLAEGTDLKHSQEQVLLPTLVLVSVQCEHYGLEKGVDFGEADETT